jgi:hypothetical protein
VGVGPREPEVAHAAARSRAAWLRRRMGFSLAKARSDGACEVASAPCMYVRAPFFQPGL